MAGRSVASLISQSETVVNIGQMRLLHLSDIHFREPECLRPDADPDVPYRTRLANDVLELCRLGGPVDAILVGGDIAFKGHPREYGVAEQWLLKLAADCGCRLDRIFVVPGNHDVDRSICAKSQSVGNAHAMIAQAPRAAKSRVLRSQLGDPDTGRALFSPLAAYNEFAAKFDCNVYPDRPFWHHDHDLGSGVTLRMFGLTSTLISGLGDRDDAPGRLYLSPLQTVLNPVPDVLNLVLCHHPPSWFVDAADVDDAVNNRAVIQLFGHDHRQRCSRPPEYIRFAAGAVNPDRNEPDWKPGYNLLDVAVDGVGAHRVVQVRAHVRHLQNTPEMFTALNTQLGEAVWSHTLPLPGRAPLLLRPALTAAMADTNGQLVAAAATAGSPSASEPATSLPEVAMSTSPSTKNLVFRFWSLSVSQKREVTLGMGLIAEKDLDVPEPERYSRALKLAAQRGELEVLAREIEKIEQQG